MLLEQDAYMMMCGNKKTLGNSIMQGIQNSDYTILSDEEIQKLKDSGRWLLELWNE